MALQNLRCHLLPTQTQLSTTIILAKHRPNKLQSSNSRNIHKLTNLPSNTILRPSSLSPQNSQQDNLNNHKSNMLHLRNRLLHPSNTLRLSSRNKLPTGKLNSKLQHSNSNNRGSPLDLHIAAILKIRFPQHLTMHHSLKLKRL